MSKITAVIHFTVLSPWTITDLTDTFQSEASISSWQPFLYKIKHCFYHEGPQRYVYYMNFLCFHKSQRNLRLSKKTLDNQLGFSDIIDKTFLFFLSCRNRYCFQQHCQLLISQFNLREKGKSSGGIACIWTIAASDVFKAVHQWLWRKSHQWRL